MVSPAVKLDPESIAKLISHPKPFQYANGSQIFNTIQSYMQALVIDLRSSADYFESHLQFSVNLPNERVGLDALLHYGTDFADKYLSSEARSLFQRRRRLYVFIIPSSDSVEHLLSAAPSKIAAALISKTKSTAAAAVDARGLLSAYVLYKAFWAEHVKELRIFAGGFKQLLERYPFLCEFHNVHIYVQPYRVDIIPPDRKKKTYPSEIFPGKLYLGDQFDAQDPYVMRNLKITHVINVTSEVPNFFEKEGTTGIITGDVGYIMYMRIDVEDKKESRIHFYFPRVFGFLEAALFGTDRSLESKRAREHRFYDLRKEALKLKSSRCPGSGNVVKAAFLSAAKTILAKQQEHFENKSPDEIERRYEAEARGKSNSNRVLVHCAMGMSRSASVVIMYIMKKFHVCFESVSKHLGEKNVE